MGIISSKQKKTVPRPPSPPLPASHNTPPNITSVSQSYPFEPSSLVLTPVAEEEEPFVNEELISETSPNISEPSGETDTLLAKSVEPIIPMFRRETDNELPEIEMMETERRKSVRVEDELGITVISVLPNRDVEISPEDD